MRFFRGRKKRVMPPQDQDQYRDQDQDQNPDQTQSEPRSDSSREEDPELTNARQTIEELERIADARIMAGLEWERDVQTRRRR
jgi:hypothetical protein